MCKICLQIIGRKMLDVASREIMKNIIRGPLFFLICIIFLLFTGCASQEKSANQPTSLSATTPIKDNDGTLLFVGEQDYAPISFTENDEVVGISPDIIREVFRRMGYKVKLQLVPWKRAQEMVKYGEADGFFSPYKSTERENHYVFPKEPLLIEKNVFMVRKDSTITYDGDISKLNQYGIGTLIGYAILENYIEKKLINNIDRSINVESSLHKLINGERKVDIIVNTDYILWYTAKKMKITSSVKELPSPLAEEPSYLAFSKEKDYTEIIAKFEIELQNMKKDGTYKKIIKKYIDMP